MSDEKPEVSVIIPTYNRANLIGRSIQSVLNQTYQEFEIIVVDDGSTDNTEYVVKGFDDARIRYVRYQENRGGSAARNAGIKIASGDYIAFQDSDDEWLPEKLEKQMVIFKSASVKVGVVYTGFWRIQNNKKKYIPSSAITKKSGNVYKSILNRNFITTQSAVIKKEVFKKTGMFDERIPAFQDWDLWIRISKYYEFQYVGEALVISYYQSKSISANKKASINAHKMILDKYFEDLRKYKKILANHYFNIGSKLYLNGERRESGIYFLKSIKTYPIYIIFFIAPLFGDDAYTRFVDLYHNFISLITYKK